MKNKKYNSGFVLQSARCDTCVFTVVEINKITKREFSHLKEEIVKAVQTLHEEKSPAACSGKLTIVFDNAVREI